MRRKNFIFSVAAAAVFAAFNPAAAQDSSTLNVSPDVGVDANVGIGNTDINAGAKIERSVSGSASANQGPADINSSSSASQSSASGDASPSASGEDKDKERHGKARGHDPDKLTGLDRADQAASEHGQQGRDNAREKQGGG